jgi:acetyltransferase
MAFLASVLEGEPSQETEIGIARYIINPDGESCEFAIVVDDAWQRRGVGTLLMKTLMEEARSKGLRCIEGQVLARNHGMLDLMKHLGFSVMSTTNVDDEIEIQVSRDL